MPEKISKIKHRDFSIGFYIELNYPYCGTEVTLGGCTKKELSEVIKNEGWKYLSSDQYGQEGYWCGCEYKD